MRLLLLAALLASPATAQQAPPVLPPGAQATIMVEPAAMAIAGWDGDGDGGTTRAELDAGVRRSFAAIDTRGAGSIGYIDYGDWAKRWLGDPNALPSPFQSDADHDNRITPAELSAQFARIFDRLDKDKDGTVTRAELLTIRASAGGPEGRGPGGRGPDGRSRDRGGPPPGQ